MKVARMGLTKPVKEGDYEGLVEVMGHLMRVKERQTATDNMFEPLKQTIELLKSYGEEMPEETHAKLQVDGPGMPRRGSWSPAGHGQRRTGPCDLEPVGQTSSSRPEITGEQWGGRTRLSRDEGTGRLPPKGGRGIVPAFSWHFNGLEMPSCPMPPPEPSGTLGMRDSGLRTGSAEALPRSEASSEAERETSSLEEKAPRQLQAVQQRGHGRGCRDLKSPALDADLPDASVGANASVCAAGVGGGREGRRRWVLQAGSSHPPGFVSSQTWLPLPTPFLCPDCVWSHRPDSLCWETRTPASAQDRRQRE